MKRLLLPLCGVVLAMGACTDTDPIDTSVDSGVALEILGSSIPSSLLSSYDRVGLYFGDEYQNVEYILADDGTLTPVDEAIELKSTALQTLAAYYPYDASRTSSALSFDVETQDAIETIYWATSSSSGSLHELDFDSAYAQLYISISSSIKDATDMTCTLVGTTTEGSIDLATGEVSTTSTGDAKFSTAIASYTSELNLNLFPTSDLVGVGFKFESTSQGYSYTYYPYSQNSEWVAGSFYTYELTLPVSYTAVESVSLGMTATEIIETETETLTATISPLDATNKELIWSSSNDNVAYVDNGVVKGVKIGTATITVTTVDGAFSASCEVTVKEYEETIAESMDLNYGSAVTTNIGKRLYFEPTILPAETDNKSVSYHSSNSTVATIDADGWLTTLSAGETTITVTSMGNSNLVNTCVVTVEAAETPLAIGQYIYASGYDMYSATYNANDDLLGVVCNVNSDGTTGTIMHISETSSTVWTSNTTYQTSATGVSTDSAAMGVGIASMKVIYAIDASFSSFPPFSFAAALNSSTVDYSAIADDEVGVWYIPSEGDYLSILLPNIWQTEAGVATVTSTSSYINSQITAAGGTALTAGNYYYTTSNEPAATPQNYRVARWKTDGNGGAGSGTPKTTSGAAYITRAVMEFDITKANLGQK